MAALLAAAAASLCFSAIARAGVDGQCPAIKDKPDAIPHVDYEGVQRITYCYGPVAIKPGQNLIRLNPTNLYPQVPGYITRFDPEFIYADGSVPPVDVVHLHHAVWIVNGNPQFASGEEKSIIQLPQGFGWRSLPTDSWYLNDMLHDLTGNPASVYVVWRIDFVPDSAPAAASIHTVHTKWMDVSGIRPYPVFDALRRFANGRRYTFPDQATGAQVSHKGPAQSWVPSHPVTLISTVGHLHPGGIKTGLRVDRRRRSTAIFRSRAHYYEPAGAVSWDVAMGATRPGWRVKLRAGDTLSVHATYDIRRADWYEVMGIMPVAVYDGTDVGGRDAFRKRIPKKGVLTHSHLAENDHHGGGPTGLPDPRNLPNGPRAFGPISIDNFAYSQGNLLSGGAAANPPTVRAGHRLSFYTLDGNYAEQAYHTITACKAPCNRGTGVAYPIANGPVTFDSGELGYDYSGLGAPASGRAGWSTPKDLAPGTYTYFCRIHPFMRGSFRVIGPKSLRH